tara:strand:- start:387 stop:1322 length:936 start_codon:yes stop_codon:yes gene_type:complete
MDYIKKFNNYTVDQFSNFHDESFNQSSSSTKKAMKGSLKRIEKIWGKPLEELNLSFLKNADETYNILKASKYSSNTQLQTFTNILKILKLVDAPLAHYNKFLKVLNLEGKRREKEENDSLNTKLDYYPPYQDVKDIVESNIDALLNNSEINFYEIKLLIVLSIFTLTIPMRISNYLNMKLIYDEDGADFKKKNNAILIGNQDNYSFIFDGNKIDINNIKLKKLIRLWLSEFNTSGFFLINNNQLNFSMNSKDINVSLSISSKNILGVSLNASDFRSIYMKYLMSLDPHIKQKILLSNIMGYANINLLEKHI